MHACTCCVCNVCGYAHNCYVICVLLTRSLYSPAQPASSWTDGVERPVLQYAFDGSGGDAYLCIALRCGSPCMNECASSQACLVFALRNAAHSA